MTQYLQKKSTELIFAYKDPLTTTKLTDQNGAQLFVIVQFLKIILELVI